MTDRRKLPASRHGETCGSVDHKIHRRLFLQGAAASALSVFSYSGLFTSPAFAAQAAKDQKHCILLWLCGAPSQFETWDPKPGRPTAGPFRSIPSKIPGVHLSELMPKCATITDKLAIIRSMKTTQREHFQAIDLANRGEPPRPPFTRPTMGAVIGQLLHQADSPIPAFSLLDPCPRGNEFEAFKAGDWAGWLGAQYSPVRVGGQYKIEDILRPKELSETDHQQREALRTLLSKRYENERQSPVAGSYNAAYSRVKGLMSCAHLYDVESLPQKDRERYGPGQFSMHSLLARHLVENGAPFVMVANGMPWDGHVFNHEIHQMLVPEVDNVIYQLITDLEQRGLLEKTLVIIMGEFGRTPFLNPARGRDHYPDAWSLALAGCGIRGGVVFGATDENGVEVKENPIDQHRLFSTIFTALGFDPNVAYDLPGLPTFHRIEGKPEPIHEILLAGGAFHTGRARREEGELLMPDTAPATPPAPAKAPPVKPRLKLVKRHLLPTGVLSVHARSADGRVLYAASADGVYELDTEAGEPRQLFAHETYSSGVAYFEAAHTLVAAGYDGTLVWYDTAAGKKIRTVKAHDFWSWQLDGSADGKYVASASGQYLCGGPKYEPAPEKEPSVKVFDATTGALVHSFPHVPPVQCVSFSPDSRSVAAANLMGEARIWDLQSGQQVGSIKTDALTSWGIIKNHFYLGGAFAVRFTPDGEDLLLAGMGPMEDPMAGNGRQLWQRFAWKGSMTAPARKVDETHAGQSGEGLMETLAIHPSGGYFVMAGRLRGGAWNAGLFSLADGTLLTSVSTETRLTRAQFTADGKRLLLGGMKGQPGFNKEGKIPHWGHVDLYELTA